MMQSLIDHLRLYAGLKDPIDVERFEATLAQIAMAQNPDSIGLLLPFLNDNCKFPEVMFSILHAIEAFDDQTYIREILKALPAIWKKSPYWTNVIHFRILNHAPSLEMYRRMLVDADPSIKKAAKELLSAMRDQEPKFRERCLELLSVL